MKEYSQRTVHFGTDIGKYLTEQVKEGWEVLHIQRGSGAESPAYWYLILVRDSKKTWIEVEKKEEAEG